MPLVSALADAAAALPRLGVPMLAALLFLLVPGAALARWRGLGLADGLAAAPGFGLLALTLAWWLSTAVGLPIAALLVVGGLAALAAMPQRIEPCAPTALAAPERPSEEAPGPRVGEAGWSPGQLGDAGCLALVWLATIVIRLATARDLALPAWVDGLHHTYLTRLLIEGRTLPADYGPLLPFGPFSYHFGFHALAASAALVTGAAPPDAVLAAGQLLTAAAAPTAYLLARLYGAAPRAALGGAALAGLVSVMPAYYVSWSRYTEMAGLAVVPAWLLLARGAGVGARPAVLAGLASAALLMVHPRVAVLVAALAVADLVFFRAEWRLRLPRLAVAGVIAAAVAAPWLARVLGGLVPRLGVTVEGVEAANTLEWAFLSTARDPWIYGVAAAAAIGGALFGVRGARVAVLWLLLVLAAANPAALGLPGSYMLSNGAVVIALWLPGAALAGWAVVAAAEWALGRVGRPSVTVCRIARYGVPLAIVLAGLALSDAARATLNPGTVLATAADRRALERAAALLPSDALVAVNVREWQLQTYMGSDAGYFVGVLTPGRAIVPPLLYGLGPPNLGREMTARLRELEGASRSPVVLATRMRALGAEWLFLGERGTTIDRAAVDGSPLFEPILRDGNAALYRLRP